MSSVKAQRPKAHEPAAHDGSQKPIQGEKPTQSGSGEGNGKGKDNNKPKPKPMGIGVLPYSSELFGVYQPLIGWKSNLSQERLADALANRMVAARNALAGVSAPPDHVIPRIAVPRHINRIDSALGNAIVAGLKDDASKDQVPRSLAVGTSKQNADQGGLVEFLREGKDSKFLEMTKKVIGDLRRNAPDTADGSAQVQIAKRELAMATLLQDLATNNPSAVRTLFQSPIDRLGRIKAGIDFFAADTPSTQAFLSPVGLMHLYREYFFQLGTFLGEPVGHVWLSPGGTVELVEVNTRRTLVEKTTEESTETTTKSEVDQTDKDELSDAVKAENANDTKLGATVSGGGGVGVWHASASASFNLDNSRKEAREETHKKMREQSSKLSTEVRQNFKTTFRTVTETTDTSSRRYVLQNTSNKLVSYELSRKMRKVAVQVQDLGARLCWQLFVDKPGDKLGVGEFVYATDSALDSGVKQPDHQPLPMNIEKAFSTSFPYIQIQGGDDDTEDTYTVKSGNAGLGGYKPSVGTENLIIFANVFKCPPTPEGYTLSAISGIDFHGASVQWNPVVPVDNANQQFTLNLLSANFASQRQLPFDVTLVYQPTQDSIDKIVAANTAKDKTYTDKLAAENEKTFFDTLRSRLKLVSQVKTRSQTDLRDEERNIVYRNIISRLYGKEFGWTNEDYHVASELIRYYFDIDSMLYFVAPDWWRPHEQTSRPHFASDFRQPTVLAGQSMSDRVTTQGSNIRLNPPGVRPKYLVTEETNPAPLGASLGWQMQIDGDAHRNAFLNSPWVKAVLPIRPGREAEAMAYMERAEVAGKEGLDAPYPYRADNDPPDPPEWKGLKIRDVLLKIAARIYEEYKASQTPEAVASGSGQPSAAPTETVFAHGYDPLEGGTSVGKDPFKPFSEWIEILPTDQIVATEYSPIPVSASTLPI